MYYHIYNNNDTIILFTFYKYDNTFFNISIILIYIIFIIIYPDIDIIINHHNHHNYYFILYLLPYILYIDLLYNIT